MMNFFYFLLLAFISFISLPSIAQCLPENLRTEYIHNPIGMDAEHPRLSWHLNDRRKGAKQTSYQIMVGTDSLQLTKGTAGVWNTGKVLSADMLVTYQGIPLNPFTKYFWTVKVWDLNGKESAAAPVSSFEMGMMHSKNWKGYWIIDVEDMNLKPAPYFRKIFTASKKVRSARAYIAVGGLYEFYLNGKKVGDHRLDPMYTRFDRRTLYLTHDITAMLQNGENAIGVLLGNGWYNHQSTAVWEFHKATWRTRPKFCMDVRIVYEDGTVETISSGTDWKTSLGPIVFNSIYTGEHYDARLEQTGWNTTTFNDTVWKNAIYTTAPSQNIVAQALHPIRNVDEIPAKKMTKVDNLTYIFDLGRNISGVSQIQVKGAAGTTVRLKHAERVDSTGRADQANINAHFRPVGTSDPFQTDIFILNGKGEEIFMPKFNYKGFQYVEVTSDKPIELTQESLKGYFMHSDVPAIGRTNSSNPTMNKLLWATNNSYLSNLFGYPTDCPQREKNGWTGDAHMALETGLYNFEGITIYEKWLADHRDEQQPNGVLPSIIPTSGWGYAWANGPDWTSTIAIIPWNIYLFYGDAHLLELCYDNIKRYVDHIDETSPSGLTSWGLGDWVPVKSVSPVEFTSSTYYYVDACILANTAKNLGKETDYKKYTELSTKIKNALNAKYLNETTGIYGAGIQTELCVPLAWGIVPDNMKAKVADNLAKRVLADNSHVDVGLLGSKAILNALSENGYADLAYTLASQETYPSWGWWIVNGATTLTENWKLDSKSVESSLNHIMFGEVGAWCYKALGGIHPDPQNPGFKNILLKPNFVTGLQNFEASHESPYGKIFSSWKRSKTKVLYTVTIPPNSSATLFLKGKIAEDSNYIPKAGIKTDAMGNAIWQLESGTYNFSIE